MILSETIFGDEYRTIMDETGLTFDEVSAKVQIEIDKFIGLIDEEGALLMVAKTLGVDLLFSKRRVEFAKEACTQICVTIDDKREKSILVTLLKPKRDAQLWIPEACVLQLGLFKSSQPQSITVKSWYLKRDGVI